MKKLLFLFLIISLSIFSIHAQTNGLFPTNQYRLSSTKPVASITFNNQSDYTLILRIIYATGGFYSKVTLPPHSYNKVSFSKSNNFKLKIKATSTFSRPSYHDGGEFSVTCNATQWTEGEMTFKLSSYGNGLGPSISANQFESDY